VTARGNRGKRPGAARPENENVQPFANADKKDSGTFAFVRRQHPPSALALTGGVGGCPPDVGGVAVGGKGGLDNRGGTDSLWRGEDESPSARFRRVCGHFERWIARYPNRGSKQQAGIFALSFVIPRERFAHALSALAPATRPPTSRDVGPACSLAACTVWPFVPRQAPALTVNTERAARREVSSAEEARVTTDARLGAAGATARARRDSVLPTNAGRPTTAEAVEVRAAMVTKRRVGG